MQNKIHKKTFRDAVVKDYLNSDLTRKDIITKYQIGFSTFGQWLAAYKQENNIYGRVKKVNKEKLTNVTELIDITDEVKNIVDNKPTSLSEVSFTMEIKDTKLTFSITSLKEVIEVIRHG